MKIYNKQRGFFIISGRAADPPDLYNRGFEPGEVFVFEVQKWKGCTSARTA